MRLVRNTTDDGSCKYRLWNNEKQAWVEDDKPGQDHEFFVIMLKDVNAWAALIAYAEKVAYTDREFAREVLELAARSSMHHAKCQNPD